MQVYTRVLTLTGKRNGQIGPTRMVNSLHNWIHPPFQIHRHCTTRGIREIINKREKVVIYKEMCKPLLLPPEPAREVSKKT